MQLRSTLLKTLMVFAMGVFLLLLWWQTPGPSLAPTAEVHTLTGSTMGTSWQVQVATLNPSALQNVGEQIVATLERLDKKVFSTYAPDSELSRLNRTPIGEALPVSRELQEVLLLARTVNSQSFGTFDVTVGPLVNLWGFGPDPIRQVPSDEAIAAAMQRLGAGQYLIDVRAGTAQRSADITLDLSAIAKGYAVDRVAELLLEAGYFHFLVEIGGEVRAQGWHSPAQSWNVAIETPQADGVQQAFAVVDNMGEPLALAGSGDYRNFFEQDGKRYSHEISPLTGRPVDHALAAVTVMASTAAEADAWATAMMVLGPIDGPLLAERRGMAVYFIIRGNEGWESRYTPAFAQYLRAASTVPAGTAAESAPGVVRETGLLQGE